MYSPTIALKTLEQHGPSPVLAAAEHELLSVMAGLKNYHQTPLFYSLLSLLAQLLALHPVVACEAGWCPTSDLTRLDGHLPFLLSPSPTARPLLPRAKCLETELLAKNHPSFVMSSPSSLDLLLDGHLPSLLSPHALAAAKHELRAVLTGLESYNQAPLCYSLLSLHALAATVFIRTPDERETTVLPQPTTRDQTSLVRAFY